MHNNPHISDAQSKAIQHGKGPMLVLAGPGSGKTLVITQRIKYLMEKHHVKPEEILVITFTKAAAKEMQERFYALMEEHFYPVTFGTFHAVFFQILKQTYHFNASSIVRESEKRSYLEEILRTNSPNENNTSPNTENKEEPIDNPESIQKLLEEISKAKNAGNSLEAFESEIYDKKYFQIVYEQYQKMLRRCQKVDFDDMVLLCYQLLKEKPEILRIWQNRFPYILIDEFQDINPLQYEVIKLLARPEDNLFVVGDDDQAIYGFRGSKPEIMLHFEKQYPQADRILLDVNYRSRKDIVQAAVKLINHNQDRFCKEVKAINPKTDGVQLYAYESRQLQAKSILSLIRQYMQQAGACYSDIAVIYRTNTNAVMTAEKLIQEKIPFQMKEMTNNIYENFIAKDIIAYLQYALYENQVKDFYRIMNKPVRYIKRESVPMQRFQKQELLSANRDKAYVLHNIQRLYEELAFIKAMSPFAAVNFIRKGIGYEAYLHEKAKELRHNGKEWEKQLDELQNRAREFTTIQEWLKHIAEYGEKMQEAKKCREDAVHIVTMHASKGLEWPIVILPDVNEGIVPHKKAVSRQEIEEERRMFFVAMTRAKEKLFIFYVQEKEGQNIIPSRFVQEILEKEKKKEAFNRLPPRL